MRVSVSALVYFQYKIGRKTLPSPLQYKRQHSVCNYLLGQLCFCNIDIPGKRCSQNVS